MTPAQEKKIKTKIARLKANLAADKKRWGGQYHDGSGNRYGAPQYYIQLADYDGGLRYMNWFDKNFPDDGCYAEFYFEWTLILFMKGKKKEASKKALNTFCSNINLFNQYFENNEKIKESTQYLYSEFSEFFQYSHKNEAFSDFNVWLKELINSEKFKVLSKEFVSLMKQLEIEQNMEKRKAIVERRYKLVEEI